MEVLDEFVGCLIEGHYLRAWLLYEKHPALIPNVLRDRFDKTEYCIDAKEAGLRFMQDIYKKDYGAANNWFMTNTDDVGECLRKFYANIGQQMLLASDEEFEALSEQFPELVPVLNAIIKNKGGDGASQELDKILVH